jgi:ABC-type multidrug transport system ATPase subunit
LEFLGDYSTVQYFEQYSTSSSFAKLQVLIDDWIIRKSTNSLNDTFLRASLNKFPQPRFTSDKYWSAFNQVGVLYLIMAFMWPFTRIVKLMLEERISKIEEGMKMMGMENFAYLFSWFFTYLVILLTTGLLLSLVLWSKIFQRSSFGFIYFYIISFSVSLICLAFLFVAVFRESRTAIQMAILFFSVGYVVFATMGNETSSSFSVNAICLYAPSCFGVSSRVIGNLENAQVGISSETYHRFVYNISFSATIAYFWLDSFIYLLFAWYLDKVMPSEFGVRKPYLFLFDKNYWFPKNDFHNEEFCSEALVLNSIHENVSSDSEVGISIRKLKKEYENMVAVSELSLELYVGEVFCLLGHNGAGKTTTISMLTGLIEISKGDAYIFGRSIRRDIEVIRKYIGVCPQQNVIFDDLSVKEHLILYSDLKGVNWSLNDIMKICKDVNIAEKLNVLAKNLSGGQKRKLCVAIAFIGNPKVVFLDEPSSGMDPGSRRATWNMIKKYKKDRIIILTTHYMDEAELLGDRIGIMSKGSLICCGSSFFLKSKYGMGYLLQVSKNSNSDNISSSSVPRIVTSNLPDAKIIEDSARLISFRVPFSLSERFPALFRELDTVKGTSLSGYSISASSLEEVFLKVAKESEDIDTRTEDEVNPASKVSPLLAKTGQRMSRMSGLQIWLAHFYALLLKRYHNTKRDRGYIACLIFVPALLLMISFIFSSSAMKFVYPGIDLRVSMYNQDILPILISANNISDQLSKNFPDYVKTSLFSFSDSQKNINISSSGSKQFRDSLANDLIDFSKRSSESLYGAYYIEKDEKTHNIWIYANQSQLHTVPVYINFISNSVLKHETEISSQISTYSEPLPLTDSQILSVYRTQAMNLSFSIATSLLFVPAAFIVFIVVERQTKAKHQQMISGVSITAYWLSNFVWDCICYLLPFSLIITLLFAFDIKALIVGPAQAPTIFCFFMFGPVSIPLIYLFSYLFDNPLTARFITMVCGYITGAILMVTSSSLDQAGGSAKSANEILKYIWRAFPGYLVGDSSLKIAMNADNSKSPWDWDVSGFNILMLCILCPVYMICVIMLEYIISVPKISRLLKKAFGNEKDVLSPAFIEDSDVTEEKKAIMNDASKEHSIIIKGLRKVYDSKKIAVHDLYFSVRNGECFGFLGINGAGKSTTLEILSGDLFPSSGTAILGGLDILKEQLKVRRLIGYCPQSDALFPLLSAREHLSLFARIKGVPEKELGSLVNALMESLALSKNDVDRPSKFYSGGNKRKLSVGISLIGDPPIVFLDEPSSGVDPLSRRFMWKLISETMSDRAVILTTHFMDECEALCGKIGIMVGGRLRCLGSAQHLKEKFASGFQLDIIVNHQTSKSEDITKAITSMFPQSRLLEKHVRLLRFQLPSLQEQKISSLADLFEILEKNKLNIGICDYSISQTTLEQIFLHFSQQQEEEANIRMHFEGTAGLSTVASSDTEIQPHVIEFTSRSQEEKEQTKV